MFMNKDEKHLNVTTMFSSVCVIVTKCQSVTVIVFGYECYILLTKSLFTKKNSPNLTHYHIVVIISNRII